MDNIILTRKMLTKALANKFNISKALAEDYYDTYMDIAVSQAWMTSYEQQEKVEKAKKAMTQNWIILWEWLEFMNKEETESEISSIKELIDASKEWEWTYTIHEEGICLPIINTDSK